MRQLKLKIPFETIEVGSRADRPGDDTDMLARSIRMYGLVMPLTVMQSGDKYTLIHGFRRYKALQKLGKTGSDLVDVAVVESTEALKVFNERVLKRDINR